MSTSRAPGYSSRCVCPIPSINYHRRILERYLPPLTRCLQKWSSFWNDTEENGYDSVAINVDHPIKLTRIAIQALLGKNKKGVVCILASVAGLAGTYAVPLYCATKHAMVGFVKSMKLCDELEGVKVTAICPW